MCQTCSPAVSCRSALLSSASLLPEGILPDAHSARNEQQPLRAVLGDATMAPGSLINLPGPYPVPPAGAASAPDSSPQIGVFALSSPASLPASSAAATGALSLGIGGAGALPVSGLPGLTGLVGIGSEGLQIGWGLGQGAVGMGGIGLGGVAGIGQAGGLVGAIPEQGLPGAAGLAGPGAGGVALGAGIGGVAVQSGGVGEPLQRNERHRVGIVERYTELALPSYNKVVNEGMGKGIQSHIYESIFKTVTCALEPLGGER